MTCYLISTDHLTDRLWFRSKDDFSACMNYCAIAAFRTGVTILAFVLMSNHLHFVIQGDADRAQKFIQLLKKMYSRHFSHKYGTRELLRGNGVDIRELGRDDNAVERAIAYVLMNPVSANICLHACQYPWGSGSVYFAESPSAGTLLAQLSDRKAADILHSTIRLPGNYLLGKDGYIEPSSFIPTQQVEKLFRTPSRMNYFLMNSSKARKNEEAVPSFRDQTISAAVSDLSVSLFRKQDGRELSEAESGELLRQLRRRFSADPTQLARVIGKDYNEVVRLMDMFPENVV